MSNVYKNVHHFVSRFISLNIYLLNLTIVILEDFTVMFLYDKAKLTSDTDGEVVHVSILFRDSINVTI